MATKRAASSTQSAPKQAKKTKSTADLLEENDNTTSTNLVFKNEAFFATKASRKWKNLKQILDLPSSQKGPSGFEWFTYSRLDAPPSLKTLPKYCDITGLQANYVDPSTGMRYHSSPIFQYIRTLGPETVQRFLQLRNAGTII